MVVNFAIENLSNLHVQTLRGLKSYISKWMILAPSSCKCGEDDMQERKCSCFNSFKQYASHNSLVGIINKLLYQAFNECYCHEKPIFTIDFF
jgi:hypothetical protein